MMKIQLGFARSGGWEVRNKLPYPHVSMKPQSWQEVGCWEVTSCRLWDENVYSRSDSILLSTNLSCCNSSWSLSLVAVSSFTCPLSFRFVSVKLTCCFSLATHSCFHWWNIPQHQGNFSKACYGPKTKCLIDRFDVLNNAPAAQLFKTFDINTFGQKFPRDQSLVFSNNQIEKGQSKVQKSQSAIEVLSSWKKKLSRRLSILGPWVNQSW